MAPSDWLTQLYAATANVPPDGAVVAARVEATIFACAFLPEAVWCQDSLRDACQEIKLFPAASEVYSVLMRWSSTYLPTRARLTIGAPEAGGTSQQERLSQASAELVASIVAALRAQASERETSARHPVKPLPLSAADLRAEYEAIAAKNARCGTPSSAVNRRVEMLRHA